MGRCNCHKKRYTRGAWEAKKNFEQEKKKNLDSEKEGKLEMLKAMWEKSKEEDSKENKE